MSQIFKAVTTGNLPPTVPTSFITDNGTAIPSTNILNILGQANSGITTSADPNNSNNLYINFVANDLVGTITTTDATPTALLTVPLGSNAGVFTFDVKIVAYCTSGTNAGNGNGYTITGAVLTNGTSATLLPNPAIDEFENLPDASVDLIVSGNNGIIQVTGIAGDTFNWKAEAEYIYRGVA
jgi:hypothetical protein